MNETPTPAATALQRGRDRTVDALCRHFALDHLTVGEFERRVDAAHRAKDAAELEALLRGLPALPDAGARAAAVPAPRPAAPGGRAERGYAVAILGGAVRRGRWTPARRTQVFTFMGGASLDFREATLPPGVTEVQVVAFMGGVEVIVPPGLAVESGGVAILGGFDHGDQAPADHAPDAPVLRIRGYAVLGGVEIRTHAPGEGGSGRHEREERRRRRGRLGPGASR